MANERAIVYAQVFEILKNVSKEKVMKIPEHVLSKIKAEKDDSFKLEINWNFPLKDQNINPNAINILAWINLNYWLETEEEKNALINKIRENNMNLDFNYENIFKHEEHLIKMGKINFFRKIISLFKK